MNLFGFNKLTPEKRKELVLVLLITAMVIAGLGFGLIKYQFGVLERLGKKQSEVNAKFEQMRNIVRRATTTESELEIASKKLSGLEAGMAARDVYSWMVDTLRRFKQPYRVDLPQVGQPVITDVNLLPRFPYKQATLKVSGTGRYHDLGRFIADFENQFPYVRILNLEITPVSAGENGALSFNMDIVTLINPNPA